MELLLEPSLNLNASATEPGTIASQGLGGHSLDEWNDAYEQVEWYLNALHVRNKLLRAELVVRILKRTMAHCPAAPALSATELAMMELDRLVNEWFAEVLHEPPGKADDLLSTRGRLALLLADMPVKWQDQFLKPAPWPEEFVAAMREAYLRAGPDFQLSQMFPRELDLGPLETLTSLSRLRVFKYLALASWGIVGFLMLRFFLNTH